MNVRFPPPVGELLYRLKNKSDVAVVDELAETAATFVEKWNVDLSIVVPVPPTITGRRVQPVVLVGEQLAKLLKLEWAPEAVRKTKKTLPMKDIPTAAEKRAALDGAFLANSEIVGGKNVLLFDDLFQSGTTMNAVTEALFDSGKAARVYALALTQNRVKR